MLRCPVDGYPLAPQAIGPAPIAICEKCSGVWFAKEALIAPSVEPDALPPRTRIAGTESRKRKTKSCPICRHSLLVESIEGIEIDRCIQCAGVWLDPGEYDAVRDRIEEERVGPRAEADPATKEESLVSVDNVVEFILVLAQIFV